ncbi:MAG: hypothetical protein WDN69_06680 [Aliidongia sp.]
MPATARPTARPIGRVKVTPKDAEPFEIWFDPATHMIAREVQLTGAQPHTFIFADFAPVDGVTVPKKTIDRVGNDPKYDTATEIAALAFTGAEPEKPLRAATAAANSAQFPAGKDSVTLPFRLINNHIYVNASIDGKAPLPFVFDTAPRHHRGKRRQILGHQDRGRAGPRGFGDKIEDFGLAKVKSVSLGGLTLPDQCSARRVRRAGSRSRVPRPTACSAMNSSSAPC